MAFGTFALGAILVVVGLGNPAETLTGAVVLTWGGIPGLVRAVLTISKLKRWSITYYIDTATTAERATADLQRAGGGLGEYYSEHDTRTPVWVCAGDGRTAAGLVGLTDAQRVGGEADASVVARWLDDGVAPGGASGRGFGERGVHGFDLTFAAPKSVSLIRALRADEVSVKATADAHATALAEAMEYLAVHAGYTRVHNPVTEQKDLVRLPGLVGVAYQHETSRCGDPHLHTHVIVPNRQARADGELVSLDGTSLFHEAKAAGVIYQATLRRELHRSLGIEWAPVDPSTGMAEIIGIERESITAWSRRSSQLRYWAARNLSVVDGPLSAVQLAAAQKATRPAKPEELAWATLRQQWQADDADCTWTATRTTRRGRRGPRPPRSVTAPPPRYARPPRCGTAPPRPVRRETAPPRTTRSIGRGWPRRRSRSTRPRSRGRIWWRSSARSSRSIPIGHRGRWWRPRSTNSGCG
jgi:conjugative relaxase-like TrwC/TraI family protein